MGRRRVTVVGAGASGMVAALVAATCGADVALLEGSRKAGRSILESGNGRCNFANVAMGPARYNDPDFVRAAIGQEPLSLVLGLFDRLGLWYRADDEGRYYPRSNAAGSVLDVLLAGLDGAGVDLRLESAVTGLRPRGCDWLVRLSGGDELGADAVIWAAGGGSADVIASDLGVPVVAQRPALCPLACRPSMTRSLDGIRLRCAAELRRQTKPLARAEGEVLLRTYGLSGIVVFDLSRLALPGDELALDLLPDIGEGELSALLALRLTSRPGAASDPSARLAFLDGVLHPRVARFFMEQACGRDAMRPVDPAGLAHALKRWAFLVTGAANEASAQVTQGGLANAAFDPVTLQCRSHPGLFCCGEALDVDGACGGFNLGWAWASGMVAGAAAAGSALPWRLQRHPSFVRKGEVP